MLRCVKFHPSSGLSGVVDGRGRRQVSEAKAANVKSHLQKKEM